MLIAEQLVLLCINPQRGEFELGRSHADMDALAAAGLLLDLYEQKRLRFNKQHVAVDGKLPTTHPQLEAAAHVLSGPTNGLLDCIHWPFTCWKACSGGTCCIVSAARGGHSVRIAFPCAHCRPAMKPSSN